MGPFWVILLGILLILWGISFLIPGVIPNVLLAILAIVGGILALVGR